MKSVVWPESFGFRDSTYVAAEQSVLQPESPNWSRSRKPVQIV